jgi:tetratricopeptide (TPR) repeat protein
VAPEAVAGGRRGRFAAAAAAVVAATVAAYAPSLDGPFQFDDWRSIEANYSLRDPAGLLAGTRPSDLVGAGRRVTNLTFALDLARGGLAPRPFHETGLAIHLVAAALAFAFALGALRAAGVERATGLAAFVAAAFALHPLQTESVCYASQRAEALASALYLAALLALLRADGAWPRRPAWGWLAAATALHLLSLGAKPIGVTLPAAFLLHRAVLGGARPGAPPVGRRLLRALAIAAPLWLLGAAAGARTLSGLGPADSAGLQAGTLGPWRYLLTQGRALWLYARLALWPAGLNVDHDLAPSPGLADPATLAAAAGIALLVAGAALLWRRAEQGRAGPWARAAAFGAGWWLLLLGPTSSFVPILDTVAEHRVYLALLGLLLAVAASADAALARLLPGPRGRAASLGAGILACAALAVALHGRASAWGDPVRLWEEAARESPGKSRTLSNLALELQRAGRTREAIAWYGRAAAAAQSPVDQLAVARNLSALLLDDLHDPTGALAVLDPAIARMPGQFELRRNRALALRALGRNEEAWSDVRTALAARPGAPEVQDLAGLVLVALDRLGEAEPRFRQARRIDPADPAYAEHHFLALFHLGRRAEACEAWGALVRAGEPSGAAVRGRAAEAGCVPGAPPSPPRGRAIP